MIHEHVTMFAGLPVQDYDAGSGLTDPRNVATRVGLGWDDYDTGATIQSRLMDLLVDPRIGELEALVIGLWSFDPESNVDPVIELLVAQRERLARLEALFLGDVVVEEQEVSWIQQGDISRLFTAFPGLVQLRVRGSDGLRVGPIAHANLTHLTFESGGLPGAVIQQVMQADLPALEHLELWLGTDEYGYSGNVAMLEPVLSGRQFPRLKYLGLKNSDEQDAIAQAVATAPIVAQLETLDLSMGTLTDEGARHLIVSPHIDELELLDIHFHYVSDPVVEELRAKVRELDASERQQADVYDDGDVFYYTAVSE